MLRTLSCKVNTGLHNNVDTNTQNKVLRSKKGIAVVQGKKYHIFRIYFMRPTDVFERTLKKASSSIS